VNCKYCILSNPFSVTLGMRAKRVYSWLPANKASDPRKLNLNISQLSIKLLELLS